MRRAGGLLNSLRDSVQVFIGSWICFRVKSGIKWRWCWGRGEEGSQGSSQSIQTIHRLLQAVSLTQVVINLTVLHSWIWGLAPSSNFPHCHPEGPLWRAEGRELECFSCTKTPLNTHLCTHVHIAIFLGATQLFTEPLWHRCTLIEVTLVHRHAHPCAHIHT